MDDLKEVKNVSLILYKVRNPDKIMSLAVDYDDGTTMKIQESRRIPRSQVVRKFFEVLTTKKFKEFVLYGVRAEDGIPELLNIDANFDFEELKYDISADEELVHKFQEKCPGLQRITKELSIQSVRPLCWMDLPQFLHRKCIKYMDFRTKMCLRATALDENELVDEKSHDIRLLRTGLTTSGAFYVYAADENGDVLVKDEHPGMIGETKTKSLFRSVFKFGKVETFQVYGFCEGAAEFIQNMENDLVYKNLSFSGTSWPMNGIVRGICANSGFLEVLDLVETSPLMANRLASDTGFYFKMCDAKVLYVQVNADLLDDWVFRAELPIGYTTVFHNVLGNEFLTKRRFQESFRQIEFITITHESENELQAVTNNYGLNRKLYLKFYSTRPGDWTHAVFGVIPVERRPEDENIPWMWVSPHDCPKGTNPLIPKHLVDGPSTVVD